MNTVFFCGGEKSQSGYIYKSTNNGVSWTKVFDGQTSLYNMLFVNDSIGYCCGEDLLLLQTIDGGNTWLSTGNEVNSDNSYYGNLHCLLGNENLLLTAGGTNYDVGIINWLHNNIIPTYWIGFKGLINEMRCGAYIGGGNYLLMGYGTVYKTTNGEDALPTEFDGDFFTSCHTLDSTLSYVCGYNGGIYKISKGGKNFEKIFDHNRSYKKRMNWNGICFKNANQGIVVGNNGNAMITENGNDFSFCELNTDVDLLSVSYNQNNAYFISTSNGKLIRVEL